MLKLQNTRGTRKFLVLFSAVLGLSVWFGTILMWVKAAHLGHVVTRKERVPATHAHMIHWTVRTGINPFHEAMLIAGGIILAVVATAACITFWMWMEDDWGRR